MNKPFKKLLKFISIIVFIAAIYLAGFAIGHRNIEFEKNFIPKIINTELGKPSDVDFSLFWDAYDVIKGRFFGFENVKVQNIVYGAISGMLDSLGDAHTIFMTKEEAKQFGEDLSGKFDGIGAEIEAQNGYLVIVAPLVGSPAEKAGLEPKDIIVKIDGNDVSNMTFSEAINKIRGKKGSIVTLTIVRAGLDAAKEVQVKRDTIVVKSVQYEMKDDIAYIKLNQFGDDTLDLFNEGIDFAVRKNAKGVIVDLRNNPGGYLQDAVDAVNIFIDKGKVVVIERGREGTESTSTTRSTPKFKDKPIVVLVNKGSASSSEIFAGAIQDYKRGKIVGEKTYGKGSVQTLEELKDGSKIKVTIAEWLTPNKRQIDKKGIEPDVAVSLSKEDKDAGKDPQLDKAMEEVKR